MNISIVKIFDDLVFCPRGCILTMPNQMDSSKICQCGNTATRIGTDPSSDEPGATMVKLKTYCDKCIVLRGKQQDEVMLKRYGPMKRVVY